MRTLIALGLIVTAAAIAYQVGVSQTATEIGRFEADLEELHEEGRKLAERTAIAEQRERTALRRASELQDRLEREVPTGELRAFLDLVEARLAEGLPAERLRFVIGAAKVERECAPATETRRFLVRTPIGGGAASTVSFAGDRITVSGEGASARNEAGQTEAWFDPAQPLRLRFMRIDGEIEVAEGVLPLTHASVLDGREWRFAAKAGEERGFVEVTAQDCAWP